MAFCSRCGAQNADGVNFCVACGAPLQQAMPQAMPQADPNMMQQQMAMMQQMMQQQQMNSMQAVAQQRQDSLNEIDRMMAYFGQKQNEYDEYDYLNELIPTQMYVKAKPMIVFGIISTVLALILLSSRYGAGAVFLVIGLGLIGGFIAINVNRSKKLNENLVRVSVLANELAEHYVNFGMCLVGAEYSNPRILAVIRDCIVAGRADTPKEAINVLLDENHKSNMEALAAQTAVNSAAAARGANVAAAFAAANFFFN